MAETILQRAKGTRDFGPEEKIKRDEVLKKIVGVFELYGYSPLETPVLERYELFAYKYGLGEQSDSLRETFKLNDQGDRKLVLRPEFTVPLARFVAMNPGLPMPFRRYQVGMIFRDGPIKLGRYREFEQCDVDVVGCKEMTADAEIIAVARDVFGALEIDVEILLNNRKMLNDVLAKIGVGAEKIEGVMVALDKLDKIGRKGVESELVDERGLNKKQAKELLDILSVDGDNASLISALREKIGDSEGLREIEETLSLSGGENVRFAPTLARGLAYYTGNVFEVFLKNRKIMSSAVAGGGRYDNMVGAYSDNKSEVPAVGISCGLDVICDVLEKLGVETGKRTVADVYVAMIEKENYKKGLEICRALRRAGFKTALDLDNKKLKKNIEYAAKQGVKWMVIAGETELKNNQAILRDLDAGEQKLVALDKLATEI